MSADFEFQAPDVHVAAPTQRIRFFIHPDPMPGETEKQGRPIFRNLEMVGITNPGSRDETVKQVDEVIRTRYREQYSLWKATGAELAIGTPLSEATFMTPAEIEELRYFKIFTVEQLAGTPDSSLHRMGHGARTRIEQAKAYLKKAKETAKATRHAAENVALKNELTLLKQQMADMSVRFNEVMKEKSNGSNPASP